jgi:hypothetical protein
MHEKLGNELEEISFAVLVLINSMKGDVIGIE